MKVDLATEITPAKLRSGGPAALAGLCDRRGAAVFAYCQQAAGPDGGAAVAAEAFAEFRRAILPPGSLTSGAQAETLLRAASRRTALVHIRGAAAGGVGQPLPAVCAAADDEIVRYLEKTLAPADHEVVAAHVGHCRSCTLLLQRLKDAEPAFTAAKPGTPLPLPVADQILTALVLAAPVDSHDGDETAVRDEALRLFTATHAPEAAQPAQPPAQPPPPAAAPPPPPPPPLPPPVQARPQAPRPQAPPAAGGGSPHRRRPRLRLPSFGRERFGPSRSAMLLRGAVKLLAVVVTAGAAGIRSSNAQSR